MANNQRALQVALVEQDLPEVTEAAPPNQGALQVVQEAERQKARAEGLNLKEWPALCLNSEITPKLDPVFAARSVKETLLSGLVPSSLETVMAESARHQAARELQKAQELAKQKQARSQRDKQLRLEEQPTPSSVRSNVLKGLKRNDVKKGGIFDNLPIEY